MQSSALVPTRAELRALLAIAHKADLAKICDRIARWDNCYQPFAEPILKLAKVFKIEEIEALLQQYLEQQHLEQQSYQSDPCYPKES